MFYHAKERTVSVSGGTVDVLSFGTGSRPLVMIPGLRLSGIRGASGAAAWYYRMFAKEYTVYMTDRKEPVSPGCTIRDFAADTAEVMDALHLQNADVFGASQGGMIAQELAIQHPALIRKLVLGVTLSRSNETVRAVIARWCELARNRGLSAVAADYMEKGYSEAYLRKYRRFLPLALRMQKPGTAERFLHLAQACLTCDTYDRLDRIQCPVLVLGGGKDKVVSAAASVEIAEKLGCPYHIYEELGHEAYNETPDFNRRIYGFFTDRYEEGYL